ncbi:MAG: radical SAM protein [Candidatus Nealsonbacteria bacterium]
MRLINFSQRVFSAFKKHILADILKGNFSKPWHFLKANFKYRVLGYPYVALIEVGNYCNLRCPTCPTPADKINRKKELMSFENFKKVIDNIKDSIHVVLLYFTNEPLLNPDIVRMAAYAHKSNLDIEISTNAVLLNKEKTNGLLESGLDRIILDLDGTTKESYEQFRVGAKFESVLENISYFCRQKQFLKLKKPFIELQFVLNKLNQNEVEDVKKIADDLRVDHLRIASFSLGEHAYPEEERKRLTDKFFPDNSRYQGKIRYKKEGEELKIKNSPSVCPLAKSHLVVLTDGNIAMCCYDFNGQYLYGDILSQKLKDVWFSQSVKNMRKSARGRKYPLCKTCAIYQ